MFASRAMNNRRENQMSHASRILISALIAVLGCNTNTGIHGESDTSEHDTLVDMDTFADISGDIPDTGIVDTTSDTHYVDTVTSEDGPPDHLSVVEHCPEIDIVVGDMNLARAPEGDFVCSERSDCSHQWSDAPYYNCPNLCYCLCYDSLCYLLECTLFECDEPPNWK
jgi:hypothetical protein